MIFIDDNKGVIYSKAALRLDYIFGKISESQIAKLRQVKDTPENFCKEELRLSLKIAKKN